MGCGVWGVGCGVWGVGCGNLKGEAVGDVDVDGGGALVLGGWGEG